MSPACAGRHHDRRQRLPAAGCHVARGRQCAGGREVGTPFADALLGYRQYGAGTVIAFNVNLVTSDNHPLDAAWSNQVLFNAIDAAVSPVPEPATYAMLGAGLLMLMSRRRRAELFTLNSSR